MDIKLKRFVICWGPVAFFALSCYLLSFISFTSLNNVMSLRHGDVITIISDGPVSAYIYTDTGSEVTALIDEASNVVIYTTPDVKPGYYSGAGDLDTGVYSVLGDDAILVITDDNLLQATNPAYEADQYTARITTIFVIWVFYSLFWILLYRSIFRKMIHSPE